MLWAPISRSLKEVTREYRLVSRSTTEQERVRLSPSFQSKMLVP